jgi:putative hydrolase of the HAD superfamily
MAAQLTALGFDADDTLWQNETFFRLTEARFLDLIAAYAEPGLAAARLASVHTGNLARYGYGIKGFTLSMVETAIEVTGGRVPAAVLGEIVAAGRDMLAHPVETLPNVRETLEAIAGRYRLILITKGDLFDQERKLAASGLGELFDAVEIVSTKDADTYRRIFARHADGPARAMMIGNSLRSDVLPALAAGSWGVHVPHELTWDHERADPPEGADRFRQLGDLAGLAALLADIG